MSTYNEEFKVSGEDLVDRVKSIIQEGNIRRISIKDKDGKVVAEFPMIVGVIGSLVVPVLAAIGAIAAFVTECTISVERERKDS